MYVCTHACVSVCAHLTYMYMHEHVRVGTTQRPEEGILFPRAGYRQLGATSHGCRELNLNPLEKHQVLLTPSSMSPAPDLELLIFLCPSCACVGVHVYMSVCLPTCVNKCVEARGYVWYLLSTLCFLDRVSP